MKLAEFKEKYIGDRAFYKRYLYLALPMIVQNAITNLVSFLDNIMVGQLGADVRGCHREPAHFCIQSGDFRRGFGSQYFRGAVLRQEESQGTYVFLPL